MNKTEAVLRPRQPRVDRPQDRPIFTPGEDPVEFGRRAARELFKKYIKSPENKAYEPKHDQK